MTIRRKQKKLVFFGKKKMSGGIKKATGPAKTSRKKHIEKTEDFATGQLQENEQAEVYYAEKAKFLGMKIKQMKGTIESFD